MEGKWSQEQEEWYLRLYMSIFFVMIFLSKLYEDCAKGGFFSESEIRFSNLPISQKNYSKKLS